jgi:ankyrin repeat protein
MGVSPRDRRLNLDGNVQKSVIDTLDLLVAAGADVNAKVTDVAGRTARIARISSMTDRDGQTALFGAVKFGWARVVEYLLAHGAKADVKDAAGKTPLNAALGKTGGRDNVASDEVAALLERGTVAAR